MSTMVAIDPGGVHVGVAGFSYDGQDPPAGEPAELPVCVRATELNPYQTQEMVWSMCKAGALHALVIESWRLFPQMAAKLVGSDMPTSQLIGSLVWMAKHYGVPVILQDPEIKIPTASLLNRRQIRLRSVREGRGGHAKDAELHGWHWLVRGQPGGSSDSRTAKREATTDAS